jgi:dipeptidase
MFLALERARTAREAVKVITGLVAEHGYASTGESISISDPTEAWLLELIGKGEGHKGAVWVARRVPDGFLTAHANAARIRTFPLKDPDTLHAPDVISFAREKGWFKGKDEAFSFADAYDPTDFGKRRFCDARVWSVFRRVAPSAALPESAILGDPSAPPPPLWVKVERKLGAQDVMALMRDHFEGTSLDMTKDVGAGPHALPYRWRPLTWKLDGKEYLNERAISTQQTGFSFVAQSRAWLPGPIGGVLWFGVDDTASTVYVPLYAGLREPPRPFAVGNGDFRHFTWDSAFWTFNAVANFTYTRYADMIVDVKQAQGELEGGFAARQADVEQAALQLWKSSPEQARAFLTDYSARASEQALSRWRSLFGELLVKYLDGNVRDAQGKVTHPAPSEAWRRRVVQETGARLEMPPEPHP